MNAYSFTVGTDYGIHAATLTESSRAFTDMSIGMIASGGRTKLETGRQDGTGSASCLAGTLLSLTRKNDTCVIGIDERDVIEAGVEVERERGAPEWNVIAGLGDFTGSFILTLQKNQPASCELTNRSEKNYGR